MISERYRRKLLAEIQRRSADATHDVVTVLDESGAGRVRAEPCAAHEGREGCPWRVDSPAGEYPAEAFRLSAATAYDMADRAFGCHQDAGVTCAGFYLAQGAHNLKVRTQQISRGAEDAYRVRTGGAELYPTYRAMAVANGVDPGDPVLGPCRDDGQLPAADVSGDTAPARVSHDTR